MPLDTSQYTPERVDALHAAFDRVKDTENWKLPVDAVITMADDEAALIIEAVIFFTGSVPTLTRRHDGRWNVTAAGYYEAIGS